MTSRKLTAILSAMLILCAVTTSAMAQDAKSEITSALHAWTQAYADRNLDALMSYVSDDPAVMMYGTGADEKRVGRTAIEEQVKRDWAQSDAISLEMTWSSVGASGDVGWVAADAAFHATVGDQSMDMPARGTWVLKKEDGKWKIIQAHFSFPAGGQSEGESLPDKE